MQASKRYLNAGTPGTHKLHKPNRLSPQLLQPLDDEVLHLLRQFPRLAAAVRVLRLVAASFPRECLVVVLDGSLRGVLPLEVDDLRRDAAEGKAMDVPQKDDLA
jgi:hypothetical protein